MNDMEAVGFEIKRMDNLLKRRINVMVKKKGIDEITMMHSFIIHYIYDNRDRDIYQKDIEKVFHMNRSTITNMVKYLEDQGYITRRQVPSDARLKKLGLTEQGESLHQIIGEAIRETERKMQNALTPQETEQFIRLSHKIRSQLEVME